MAKTRRGSCWVLVAAIAFALLAPGCGAKEKWYDSTVAITRMDIVRRDDKGAALDMDIEFSYEQCPGQQMEVIRGDATFAACMQKHKIGDKVPVRVQHHALDEGYWDWDIQEMDGCKRSPDPDDRASFDTVQECEPILVNGVKEGFRCNRIPERVLLNKCPWFARR